jgi:cell filamentation protein, protein adenylyltransferase
VTFDPFGDFATRGYLRNLAGEKDPEIVRRLEHASFITGIDAACRRLAAVKRLSYQDVLDAHRVLFEAIYPWAGQDRLQIAPELAVGKGPVLFARPTDIRRAVDYALDKGQDKGVMVAKPGEVMGYLAYAHPFLDGNGRTIMVVHAVMAQRAGFSVDWAVTAKPDYLSALTKELDEPGRGHLDVYLKRFLREAVADDRLVAGVAGAPGLDGSAEQNQVLGKTSDPALHARYELQELKRRGQES